MNQVVAVDCDWFVDKKLSIHFGEDKTKYLLFGIRLRLNKVSSLDISKGEIQIKQYSDIDISPLKDSIYWIDFYHFIWWFLGRNVIIEASNTCFCQRNTILWI